MPLVLLVRRRNVGARHLPFVHLSRKSTTGNQNREHP